MKKYSKGFTLIELLVVIAIIGILSSVVLASLNGARTKANVNGVKATMKEMLSQSSIYYDANGYSYGTANVGGIAGTCPTSTALLSDPLMSQAISYIVANASTPTCVSNDQKWAISTTLKNNTSWCVDSGPTEKASTANTTTGQCN